jgi:hypothetical protein
VETLNGAQVWGGSRRSPGEVDCRATWEQAMTDDCADSLEADGWDRHLEEVEYPPDPGMDPFYGETVPDGESMYEEDRARMWDVYYGRDR